MYRTRPLSLLVLSFAVLLILSCGGGSKTLTDPSVCGGCQFVYSTTTSGQILAFPVSNTTYALGTPKSIDGPANSTGIAVFGAIQPYVYVSDPANNSIRAYVVNSSDGSLSPALFGPTSLENGGLPGDLVVFGSTLYAASSNGGVFAFNVNADGSLASVSGSPFPAGSGLSHLAIIPSQSVANTTFLYAANTGDPNGSISAFSIAANGVLTPVAGSPFATVSGGGPAGFYDGGNVLYVALKNANAVAAFTIAADGSLSPIAGSPFPAGGGTSSLTGADGFLFATNSLDGTISSYAMDPYSGNLTQVSGSPFTASIATGDTLYDNGTLFVPDASANSISGFHPDLSTGVVNSQTGSPYQATAGPLALAALQFPAIDPP